MFEILVLMFCSNLATNHSSKSPWKQNINKKCFNSTMASNLTIWEMCFRNMLRNAGNSRLIFVLLCVNLNLEHWRPRETSNASIRYLRMIWQSKQGISELCWELQEIYFWHYVGTNLNLMWKNTKQLITLFELWRQIESKTSSVSGIDNYFQ